MVNNSKKRNLSSPSSPRKHRMVCLLSDGEMQVVERYLARYRITNRGRWLRETVLSFIHRHLEEDYPTLFKEHDMRR